MVKNESLPSITMMRCGDFRSNTGTGAAGRRAAVLWGGVDMFDPLPTHYWRVAAVEAYIYLKYRKKKKKDVNMKRTPLDDGNFKHF